MKHLFLVFFLICSVLIFFSCQEESVLSPEVSKSDQESASLAKPAPNLIGETYTDFTFTPPIFWHGTIDFGEIGVYGLYFISPEAPTDHGQSSHFWEEWVIHENGVPENICLRGWNEGVVSNANGKFRANGEVTGAYGQFEGWFGRKVHISGTVVPSTDGSGFPLAAIGTLRIN